LEAEASTSQRCRDSSSSSTGKDFLSREAALEQDNSQWTGENRLLEPEEIVILDEKEREQLNRQHHTSLFVTMIMNNLI
jgi:hypothetical protein